MVQRWESVFHVHSIRLSERNGCFAGLSLGMYYYYFNRAFIAKPDVKFGSVLLQPLEPLFFKSDCHKRRSIFSAANGKSIKHFASIKYLELIYMFELISQPGFLSGLNLDLSKRARIVQPTNSTNSGCIWQLFFKYVSSVNPLQLPVYRIPYVSLPNGGYSLVCIDYRPNTDPIWMWPDVHLLWL